MALIALDKWGPATWVFLHAVTFTYPLEPPDAVKEQYRTLFDSLPFILPCKICRHHLKDNYTLHPIDLNSRRTLSEWLVNIHNKVNLTKGKPKWSYAEVVRLYLPPSQYASVGISPSDIKPAAAVSSSCSYLWIVIAVAIGLIFLALVGVLTWKYFKTRNISVRLISSV
jgi:hypothetical protein